MAKKEVIWASTAKLELNKTLEFYTERNGNPDYSLKLLKEIEDLLDTLSKNEFIGRLTSNNTTRLIPMKVYLIFYEIHKNKIEIVTFWDNRQDENKKDAPLK
jgi:toxin YoeB